MSEKRYFTIIMPLSDDAQSMIGLKSGQYQLRATLWSCAAQRMKPLLGKTCSMYAPAVAPAYCNAPVPFGVALGAVEPHEFLMRYFVAQQAQENEIKGRVQRIRSMGQTVFSKQISKGVEVALVAMDMSDPALQGEMEFADRFFRGDITAACGLYFLGPDRCHVEVDVEKSILSHLDEYAVCVAKLEV